MAQYNNGQVTVTNGSAVVTGTDTSFTTAVSVGQIFFVTSNRVFYTIASVDSDTQITLNANYVGPSLTTPTGGYAIVRDFTPNFSLPFFQPADVNTAGINQRQMEIIDQRLGAAVGFGATGTLAQRSNFDAQGVGFVYYAYDQGDTGLVYVLQTTPGGWGPGFAPFGAFPQNLGTTDSPTFAGLTITGNVVNSTAPTLNTHLTNKLYVDNQVAGATDPVAVLDEGTQLTANVASLNFTGTYMAATNVGDAVTVDVTVPNSSASVAGLMTAAQFTKLNGIESGAQVNDQALATTDSPTFAGLTITGNVVNNTAPTVDTHLTNKLYVDTQVAGGVGSVVAVLDEGTQLTADAASLNFTGTYISATNVGDAVTVDVTVPNSSASVAGLMTAAQFTKLANLDDSDPPTFQGANFTLATGDGPVVAFSKPSNQTVPDSPIGQLTFSSQDNTGVTNQYARIVVEADDQRPGADRQGSIVFRALVGGVEQNIASFNTRDNPGDASYNGNLIVAMDGEIRNGNLELGAVGATAAIFNGKTTSQTTISGGSTASLGANLTLFGEQNAANPNDWEFKTGAVAELSFDSSANTFNFQGNRVRNIDNLAGGDSSGALTLVAAEDNPGGAAPSSLQIRSNLALPPLRNAILFRAPNPTNPTSAEVILDWDNANRHWDFYNNDVVRIGSLDGLNVVASDATLGVSVGQTSRLNATNKTFRAVIPSFSSDTEENVTVFAADAQGVDNTMRFGGGDGDLNAATRIEFWTAANNTTLQGQERFTIDETGKTILGGNTPELEFFDQDELGGPDRASFTLNGGNFTFNAGSGTNFQFQNNGTNRVVIDTVNGDIEATRAVKLAVFTTATLPSASSVGAGGLVYNSTTSQVMVSDGTSFQAV